MTVARQMEVRANIRDYFDRAYYGETVFVPRKENKNVYIISQEQYEALQTAKKNAEYLMMLDRSLDQLEKGQTVTRSLEDLRAME